MSSKKRYQNLTVMRSVQVPLSDSDLQARMKDLPVIMQKRDFVESRKKDAMSGFKAELDEIADTSERLVREINSGHTIQDLLCPKVADLESKEWHIIHPTTGEIMEREPMKWKEVEDLCQTEIPIQEEDEPVVTPEIKILALPAKDAEVLQEDVIQGEVVTPEGDED